MFHQDNGSLELPVGLEGHFLSAPLEGTVLGANGRWRNRNTLEVEVRNTRMVSGQRMLFQFAGDKLTVSGDITLPDNGGLAGKCLEPVAFTLREGETAPKPRCTGSSNLSTNSKEGVENTSSFFAAKKKALPASVGAHKKVI